MKFAAVDQAGDDFALVERSGQIGTDNAGNLGEVEQRRARGANVAIDRLHPVQGADDVAGLGDRLHLVVREMIRDAGSSAVHLGAAQRIAIDDLVDGGLLTICGPPRWTLLLPAVITTSSASAGM